MRSANGAVILVLGILAWVGLGCLTGLPAWIMGNQALADIDRGRADPNERGLVQAGRILGMINCLLLLIPIGFIFVALVFGMGIPLLSR